MRKKIVILFIMMLAFTCNVNAQKNRYSYHNTGYWGNIEAVGGTLFTGGSDIGVSTVHGARLGNGLAMGIGVAVYCDINELYYEYSVPIFLETKYSPFKSGKSPYISLRTGFSVNDYHYTGFYLSPSIGVDIDRLSLFVRYGMNLYPMNIDIDIPGFDIEANTNVNIKTHALSVGVAVNF